jgi:hypothetical protein
MQITRISFENFLSIDYDTGSIEIHPQLTLVEIEESKRQIVFSTLRLISAILLRRYKDQRSFIKPYFSKVDPTTSIKVDLGLTMSVEELQRISDFIISSEIPMIKSMNDVKTGDLKIKIARMCLRNQISTLFRNPVLEITVRNPEFYQDDYVVIHLRIENEQDNFSVDPEQGSGDAAIIKGVGPIPKGFNRIFFSHLLFDNLSNLHPDLNIESLQFSIDSELDIFSMLSKNEYSEKYVGITTVPSPYNAGVLFEERPELKALSNYLNYSQNSALFTYGKGNVIFFDLIRVIYKNFITNTELKSPTNNWVKLLVERIDPNLMILQSWLRGHTESGSAREIAPSFEKGVTLLLNLCGYHALHVGDKYEVAAEKGRKEAGKASPGIDIFALSPDEREVLLVQCTTEWNDQSIKQKLSNISAITVELRARFSAMENSPELYSSVVPSVSRDTLPPGIGMPKQVKIVDVNDLQTLLCDVRNGIQPYELAKKIFT